MPLSGASCEPTPVTPGRGPCANSWIASLGLPSTVRSNVAPFTSVNRIAATGAGPYIQPEVQAQVAAVALGYAAGVSLFTLARRMGTSVEQIDKTYGHLLPDAEDHERGLLDAYDARSDEAAAES
jgi:hypothetical protein